MRSRLSIDHANLAANLPTLMVGRVKVRIRSSLAQALDEIGDRRHKAGPRDDVGIDQCSSSDQVAAREIGALGMHRQRNATTGPF